MSPDPDKSSVLAARALEGQAWEALGSGDVRQAISSCEELNRDHPDYASGWHTASHLAMRLNNPAMALVAIDRALALQPDHVAWLLQKGLCLLKLGQIEGVNELVGQLAGRTLQTAYQCSSLALLLTQLGRREEAVSYYEQAAKLGPDDARHYYNIACLQRSLGEVDAAERNFDKAIELDPADYEAWKTRSELRTQTEGRNHVAELEALLQQGIGDERGAVQVGFAMAKELEDLGRHEQSFRYLRSAADTRRGYMQYDLQRDLDTIAAIRATFDADFFSRPAPGADNREAIFVLGLPRTGTTLVERILASHSEVFAAGELSNFAVQMTRLAKAQADTRGVDRDEFVALTAALDFERLGQSYIESTRPFTGHTPRFIDKLPLNYLYVGLIHRALPNAKIINLQRHPVDTCYAIYKQLFVDAYPFSYDLEELGRYYVAYRQLMQHWNDVLPGVVHTVEYETLVTELEPQARALLAFCELGWQPDCLSFHENREASTTASTVQVRQPVYTSSVGKWRAYEQQLAPLIRVLEAAGVAIER